MKEAYRIVCSLCTNMIRMTKYDIFCRPASAGRFSSEKVVTVNLTSTAWYKQQSGEHDGIFTLRQPLLTHAAREWVSERKRKRKREGKRGEEGRREGKREDERSWEWAEGWDETKRAAETRAREREKRRERQTQLTSSLCLTILSSGLSCEKESLGEREMDRDD